MSTMINIGNKSYEAAPLKLKHLRQIERQIEEANSSPRKPTFESLYNWVPFIAASIQAKNPEFKTEELDDMTIDEFSAAWDAVLKISGFRIIPKGEIKPTGVTLTTSGSTEDSPSAAVGPTLQ